jgi:hypothetical protein
MRYRGDVLRGAADDRRVIEQAGQPRLVNVAYLLLTSKTIFLFGINTVIKQH